MSAPPEHRRAPAVERAALKEANDLFARLLSAAILNGSERDVVPLVPAQPGTQRPMRLVPPAAPERPAHPSDRPAMKDYCRAWREKQREIKRALRRDARRAQADLLAPKPRPRPPVGQFTIMDLAEDTCRFPFGDGPFLFCGATPLLGKPYCARCLPGLYRKPEAMFES